MDRKTAEMSFEEGHFQNGKNMKIRIIIAVLFFGIFPLVKHSQAATPADPNALPVTKAVLEYLANLPNNGSSNRIIAGQHTYMTDNLIPSIYRDTGKYPGLIGIDYFYQNNSSTNTQAITWAHNMEYHLDGTKTLFADPWVITADEIPSFDGGGTTDTMPPAAPTGLRIN